MAPFGREFSSPSATPYASPPCGSGLGDSSTHTRCSASVVRCNLLLLCHLPYPEGHCPGRPGGVVSLGGVALTIAAVGLAALPFFPPLRSSCLRPPRHTDAPPVGTYTVITWPTHPKQQTPQ